MIGDQAGCLANWKRAPAHRRGPETDTTSTAIRVINALLRAGFACAPRPRKRRGAGSKRWV